MDQKTIQKAMKGDKKAFGQLYNEYFDCLWRYIYSRIKNKEIASDIVSESFIALYENIKNVKHPKAVKSYLYQIAKHKLVAFYASEKPISLSEFIEDRVEVEVKEQRSQNNSLPLEDVLSLLPKKYEEVLRLRFLAGMKIREVAETLHKTEGNVKVIQNRAIKKAQEIFDTQFSNFKMQQ